MSLDNWTIEGELLNGQLNASGVWSTGFVNLPISVIAESMPEDPPVFDYANAGFSFHLVASVPEPSSAFMLLAGGVLLSGVRRIRQHASG